MSTLTAVTEDISILREEIDAEDERHREARGKLESELADATARQRHLALGVDEETRAEALGLIAIYGDPKRATAKIIQEAVEDIATGCHDLRDHWLGLKDYDRWRGQELLCSYIGDLPGNPKHGTVVFAIGLTRSAREFWDRWGKPPVGENGERVHAATRYLLNLREAGVV